MITIRRAVRTDSEFLFSWANDPAVIAGSFMRSGPISLESHREWFAHKLADPAIFLFVVSTETGDPAGQVRFDRIESCPSEALISIGIAPSFRKRGYATDAIREGTRKIFEETDIIRVNAYIQLHNEGSKKAFEHAGYEFKGKATYSGVDSYHMSKDRGF